MTHPLDEAAEELTKTIYQQLEGLPSAEQMEAAIKALEAIDLRLDEIAGTLRSFLNYVLEHEIGR